MSSCGGCPGEGAAKDAAPVSDEWSVLEGFNPESPKFPTRARLAGEGILVVPFKDGFRGFERACPHLRASLVDAVLMANGTVIRCPQHNFTFKLTDGRGVSPPNSSLRVYEIKIENGTAFGRPLR